MENNTNNLFCFLPWRITTPIISALYIFPWRTTPTTTAPMEVNTNNNLDEEHSNLNDEKQKEQEEERTESAGSIHSPPTRQRSRIPFTNLSKEEADLAIARTIREQERVLMMIQEGSGYGSGDDDSEDVDDNGNYSEEEDEFSYEELVALGEVVGTESRGLSADSIASLPSMKYKMENNDDSDEHGIGSNDSCVICQMEYEDGESLTALSCKHLYHPQCIDNWLKINKICPICITEVSACRI